MLSDASQAYRRFFLSVILALFIALQPGCIATPKIPETKHQTGLGEVAVVAPMLSPEINFEGFAHNKGEGAVQSAQRWRPAPVKDGQRKKR